MKRSILIFIIALCCNCGNAQKGFNFRFWEDSLVRLRHDVMMAKEETERMLLNEDFMNILENVLLEPKSFAFIWDSVKNFSVITSPDNLFRIFTWYVEKDNYVVENFGFIQYYNERRKKYVLFPLYDKRNTLDRPGEAITDHNQWYGAVYYKLIPVVTKQKTYYTLLGWNGNNLFTNQKIIEVLHFKDGAFTPVFGAKIFKGLTNKSLSRIIFEYNKNSSLSLKYEKHAYPVNSGKRDIKTKRIVYETVTDNVIIFDMLIPMDNSMEYIAAFAIPESSLNQGFVIKDGKWCYLQTVFGRGEDLPTAPYRHQNRTFYTPPN